MAAIKEGWCVLLNCGDETNEDFWGHLFAVVRPNTSLNAEEQNITGHKMGGKGQKQQQKHRKHELHGERMPSDSKREYGFCCLALK